MKVQKGEKHFCASAWILSDTKPQKILLLHHKKLKRWLQPGGHIEQFENPIETVIREVKEETGIDISDLQGKIIVADEEGSLLPMPKFMMEQTIPATANQPQHFHIDIQFVITVKEQDLQLSASESHDIGWFTKEEALKLPIHEDTRIVLQQIMS